jgi:short-subunit dehydrogenase
MPFGEWSEANGATEAIGWNFAVQKCQQGKTLFIRGRSKDKNIGREIER